ncbi:dipeptidase [Pararhodobacter sp. SW119]|uniref:dipeptidase n=1 Tax=Pararhodobacter sp. SW119 TaxID=2780075 RepID=UPI001ADECE3A|nr:dipeptidase [Pararhodobacter sp. SW119]
MSAVPVFDGHNDLLLHLWRDGDSDGKGFFDGRDGHLDLARCRAGGLAGGFFAIWVPGEEGTEPAEDAPEPIFPELAPDRARRVTLQMAAILHRMARSHPQDFRICTSADAVEGARRDGAIAALMHIEGCEGIGPDLAELEVYHAAGMRSLGPVWSRDNIFGHGVPFRFPADPDIGPGLTDAGRRLVRECARLGILVDLSHLNAAGFRDVAALTEAPLVATHSCVHAICAGSRNLTDWQLDMIAERGGLVGLNYAVQFLRPDGEKTTDTPPELLIRHLDHLIERLGEGGVALGSDFDGATMPDFLPDAAALPRLVEAMVRAGYDQALVRRLCWGNWIDLLRRTIG